MLLSLKQNYVRNFIFTNVSYLILQNIIIFLFSFFCNSQLRPSHLLDSWAYASCTTSSTLLHLKSNFSTTSRTRTSISKIRPLAMCTSHLGLSSTLSHPFASLNPPSRLNTHLLNSSPLLTSRAQELAVERFPWPSGKTGEWLQRRL